MVVLLNGLHVTQQNYFRKIFFHRVLVFVKYFPMRGLRHEARTFDLLRRLGAFWLRFNIFLSRINRSPL